MAVDATLKVPDSYFTKRHLKEYMTYLNTVPCAYSFESRQAGIIGMAIQCRGVEIGMFSAPDNINPTIERIKEIAGKGWQKITNKFISEVKEAFKLPITADPYYKLNDVNEVVEFLEQHKGKPVFYMDM